MPDTTPLVAIIVLAGIAFALLIGWTLEVVQHRITAEELEVERYHRTEAERDAELITAALHELEAERHRAAERAAVPFDQETA